MIKTFELIKPFYPNINFITCVLHLLYNCALRIRSYYKKVDQLISSVKLLTVKNSTKQEALSGIGRPPCPIITRLGTCLKVVDYYSYISIK